VLERIRRLARSCAVIRSGRAIFRLFLDMTRCLTVALDDPGPNDEITWFPLQRFLEERIDEFVHGYREDLGIGRPTGAPPTSLSPRTSCGCTFRSRSAGAVQGITRSLRV
jgi:hypothetical protein